MTAQRLWLVSCLVAAGLVGGRALLQPFSGQPWHTIACDVLGVIRTTCFAIAMLWAAHAGRASGMGAAWRLLAAGAIAWLVADIIWLVLAVVGTQPWASAADIFFLLFYPCFLAGILALPRQHPRTGGAWAAVLDVGVILNAAGAAMWVLLVEPGILGSEAGFLATTIAVAYPVGDLLLLWAACDLLFRGRARTAPGVAALLAGGAAALIAADLVFAVQILRGTYVSGNPLGIIWTLSLMLIGLAGMRQATADQGADRPARDPRMTTAVLAAVAMLATWGLLIHAPADPVARCAAGLSVVLMLVRQAQALVANRRLEEDLQRINSGLEERVRERTAELARAQQRLVEAERLEAVGRVAGAVAHDFNNILTAVSGHAELAAMRSDDPAVKNHLEQVMGAVQRASELGRRLVATARPPDPERRPTDLSAIAAEVAGQIGAALPHGIDVALDSPTGGIRVNADGGQLHQLLMNLCANARDAMPAGGRLGIRIAPVAGQVEIAVSDTGCGMTETVRSRLFEPYFTTKGAGRGNGLGLATVHAIVRQHGGSIDVETTPGRGSVFRVRLPAG